MSQPAPMTIDAVIEEFRRLDHVLPRAAMQWALDHWAEAAPRFLELLSHYADGTDRADSTANALLLIIHLLAERRETAAFAPLCHLLHDRDAIEASIGENAVTESLRQILIMTFDGNVGLLRAVIEDHQADEFVRDGALLVLAWLTRAGRIPDAETHAYLRQLLTTMRPQEDSYIWVGWTECVSGLGYADLAPEVKALFQRGFIDPMFMSYQDFADDLQAALSDPGVTAGFPHQRLEPFTSAIAELGKRYCFSEQRIRNEKAWAEREALRARENNYNGAARNPLRHVGRNNACPCGSGRKLKKCCLGKAELLTTLHAA